jgi:flavin reductase (DIM6/NTAB) family NADH-FMN oxidoreductase RutF
VSVFYAFTGALERPTTTALSTTDATDVFIAPSTGPVTVTGIIVVNTDTSNACRVTLSYHIGGTDYVIFTGEIEAGETETEALKSPIRLDGKHAVSKIKAQASAGGDLVVTVIVVNANEQSGK